jgi:hypothetical protein
MKRDYYKAIIFLYFIFNLFQLENLASEKILLSENSETTNSVIASKTDINIPQELNIPPRASDALTGSEFMQKVLNMSFADREIEIYNEISTGNIPKFLRELVSIETSFNDENGKTYTVKYEVMPDYLAIGSDEDFCRIPMGPITAQKLADLFGAVMPTRKLVDNIYQNCEIKLEPVTFFPVGNQNELVPKFIEQNNEIEEQRMNAGGLLGQLTGGTKKDVVLSNKIIDPNRKNHVVIYGWHRLTGDPIQPLTNIHVNTYVDYSHGIRFLNSQFLLDGELKEMEDILSSPNLYKILSDEFGVMVQPTYIAGISLVPETPRSFGITSDGDNEIQIIIDEVTNADKYLIYPSSDGIVFSGPIIFNSNIISIANLETNSLYFIKVIAQNSFGNSRESEVLSIITADKSNSKILIVNGFDRTSDGNTFNFVRQHSEAIRNNSFFFESATNDAVLSGIVNLEDYAAIDYILGDESTADETFSNLEQNIIKSYLQDGGKLFISGSELAWDLDYRGSSIDKNFIWNYLKSRYIADAPNNSSSTYYEASVLENSFFEGIPLFNFDNGDNGTINVKWPDVIKGINGGKPFLQYSGFDTTYGSAGIFYEGLFPDGTSEGKIVIMGFPFETIYPEEIRNQLMEKIISFFDLPTAVDNEKNKLLSPNYFLAQNYPNPFNPTTTIEFSIPENGHVSLTIYDVLGSEATLLVNEYKSSGKYTVKFDAAKLTSGIYFYTIRSGKYIETKKMQLLK